MSRFGARSGRTNQAVITRAVSLPGEGGYDSPSQELNRLSTVDHMNLLTLNNDIAMPALGLGVFQTPVIQIEVHPYFQQPQVQAFGAERRDPDPGWSPIGGITFYRDGSHGSTLENPVIGEIAETHGRSPAQVMLGWHLQQGRSVIPKATPPN